MAIYYIDKENGNNALDGLSPERARADYRDLQLISGDSVLFKRGSFYRDRLHAVAHVCYGAYGEGEKPTFCGSTDVSREEDWVETETPNVWRCVKEMVGDVGNMVFNADECTATFRWKKEQLVSQGDYFDERIVVGDRIEEKTMSLGLYLYSVGNPARVYSHIEAVSYNQRQLVVLKDGMTFDSLRFINSGVHGMAGQGNNITVRNCDFENIGGCAWSYPLEIRFGNGFEIWHYGDDILLEGCTFKSVYDSCVTHQGPGELTKTARNFICRSCTFDTYGMAAFEYRDKMPIASSFTGNTCINAGCGFAMLGETLPRKSEIWPQPMGHHIFMWRIPEASEGGDLLIENNYFGEAPVGAAIYSIISPEAEAQVKLDNNKYTRNEVLLNRWGGVDYSYLSEYKTATGQDKNSSYAD